MDIKRFLLRSFINLVIILVLVLLVNLSISLFLTPPNQDYANSKFSVDVEKCNSDSLSCRQQYSQLEESARERICIGIYEGCFAEAQLNEPFAVYSKTYFMIAAIIGLLIMLIGLLIAFKGYIGIGILLGGFLTVTSSIKGLFNTGHGWSNFIMQYSIAVIIALLILVIGTITYFIKRKKEDSISNTTA